MLVLVFYLYHTFFNMTCISLIWTVAGDALKEDSPKVFGLLAAGGTAGQLLGAVLVSWAATSIGTIHALLILVAIAVCGEAALAVTERHAGDDAARPQTKTQDDAAGLYAVISKELFANFSTLREIWTSQLLQAAFVYSVMHSVSPVIRHTS